MFEEKKEKGAVGMKFWRTMEVWQREELLRKRELPRVKEGWEQLMDQLHQLESSSGMTGRS